MGTSEVKGFFQLLDIDGSGGIAADEFMSGCLQLRGPAKALELALLMHEVKRLSGKIVAHTRYVESWMESHSPQHMQVKANRNDCSLHESSEAPCWPQVVSSSVDEQGRPFTRDGVGRPASMQGGRPIARRSLSESAFALQGREQMISKSGLIYRG